MNGYGFGISKEKVVVEAYRNLEAEVHKCCLINERYINVDGADYMLSKSHKNGGWIVKEF